MFKMFKNKGKDDKSWKAISSFAAIIMTIVYAVFVTNVLFDYIPYDSAILVYINNIIYYGPLAICAVTSIAAVSHKGFAVRLTFLIVWVGIFLFAFFPDTFYSLIR